MRLAALLLTVPLLLLAGCGEKEETTATPPAATEQFDHAAEVDKVRAAFEQNPGCERPRGASRWGCSVGSYRCQGVVTGRGWSVSCSKPGASLAFRIEPG